jgi:glycosyltransferase involved in cell wall biosynthesis
MKQEYLWPKPVMDEIRKPRVLILARELASGGGVVNFVRILLEETAGNVDWTHFVIGKRLQEKASHTLLRLMSDYVRLFANLMVSSRYDAIHINPSFERRSLPRDIVFLLIANLFYKRRTLFFVHGWDWKLVNRIRSSTIRRTLLSHVLNRAGTIIVLSEQFRTALTQLDVDRRLIHVMPMMFDRHEQSGCSPNEDGKPNHLLFLARVTREKGIFELLEAVGMLRKRGENVHLTVAGDGEALSQAKQLAAHLAISEFVEFVGYVRDDRKMSALSKSRIFVLPSYREGCPVSMLEAMACGLAVVATGVGGIPEIVKDGTNGIVLENGSSTRIAAGIEVLLRDPELLTRMSRQNRADAWSKYASNVVAPQIVDHYMSLA